MDLDYRNRLTSKIKELAALAGITQAELARRVGMQPSHLNVFLQGKGDIHSRRLIEILAEVGIDLEGQLDEELSRRNPKSKKWQTEPLVSKLRSMSRAEVEAISLIVTKLTSERRKQKKQGRTNA